MQDNTNWTPSSEDNKLNITDKNLINEYEAKGIAKAELFVFFLDSDIQISTKLLIEIHKIVFEELYEWAGKWRTVDVLVGQLVPPSPGSILNLMYQFIDNLNYKIHIAKTEEEQIECLLFAHYEFVKIHPFNNGNGRTGRILMNIIALKYGYKPFELYHRTGDGRKIYIDAMRAADKGDYQALYQLIKEELTPF